MITVWDTTIELKKIYSFDARYGTLITKKELKSKSGGESTSSNPFKELHSVWLVQSNPSTNQKKAEPSSKQTKWIDWCTTDIEVYVTDKALYPGAKGVVFDIIDKDTICVFLTALTEVINFPISHVCLLRFWIIL
jgi:hypothetical protein